jgi:metal-dependent hydrolase (beta-lactamase superfamily II)
MTPDLQTTLSLPARPTDEILREKIRELEVRLCAAMHCSDREACARLEAEVKRLRGLIGQRINRP